MKMNFKIFYLRIYLKLLKKVRNEIFHINIKLDCLVGMQLSV